jgi:hypothetical protein
MMIRERLIRYAGDDEDDDDEEEVQAEEKEHSPVSVSLILEQN